MKTKKREIKTYKTVEETFNAKHEAARKFIQTIDVSQIEALHPTKNP